MCAYMKYEIHDTTLTFFNNGWEIRYVHFLSKSLNLYLNLTTFFFFSFILAVSGIEGHAEAEAVVPKPTHLWFEKRTSVRFFDLVLPTVSNRTNRHAQSLDRIFLFQN